MSIFCSKIRKLTTINQFRCCAYISASKLEKCQSSTVHYGQPTATTHPHLMHTDELVTGVKALEFKERRNKLMLGIQRFATQHLNQECGNNLNHLVVIPSATTKYMSDKIPYIFRQNSDFFYLTGCLEPDTVLALTIDDKSNIKSILFMRPKDKHAELWEGSRTGVDAAIDLFGVDEAYPAQSFETELQHRLKLTKPVLWHDSKTSALPAVSEKLAKAAKAEMNITTWQSPNAIVQGMRLIKSPAEQNLMRRTCQIASKAINEVIHEARPGHTEHHIHAMIDFKCRMQNASRLAYPPVVASGTNGTTIHYINNTQMCKSGDLVLMDAGCEYGGYSSDITRTWPISGQFTEAQRVLYEIVLKLQQELIATLCKEGGQTLDYLFETMCLRLGKYLQEIGLIPKSITDVVSLTRAGYQFCPHHVSHYLGMDVHDTPLMPRAMKLLPGMVCTVEPGIYISEECQNVPKEFRGIGIRIEDDVLIKDNDEVEVLTESCNKNYPI